MEFAPPLPEADATPEQSPEIDKDKKRRRFNKLLAHYSREGREGRGLFRFSEVAPTAIANEEAKSAEVKTGRRQNFLERFRHIFSVEVANVEFLKTDTKKPDGTLPEVPTQVAQEENAPRDAAEEETPPPETSEYKFPDFEPLTTPQTPAPPEIPAPPAPPNRRPPVPPTPPAGPPPMMPPPPGGGEGPPEPPEAAEPPEPPEPPEHDPAVADRVVAPFRTAEATTPSTPSVERIIEHRRGRGTGLLAALLGLEYLGRKRADRKIRKDFGKQMTRQQAETRQAFNRGDIAAQTTAQELREVRAQQRAAADKLTAIEAKRPAPLPAPEIRPEIKLPPAQKERLEPPQPVAKPELPPQKVVPLEKLAVAERVVEHAEQLKKPQAVMERMAVAAEQNLPVETVYERRHETKPEPRPIAGGGGGAGPQGGGEPTLLATALQQRMQSPQIPQPLSPQPQPQPPEGSELYKQAVRGGIWAAVAILIFMVIAYLVMRR